MQARTAGLVAALLLATVSAGHAEDPQGWAFELTPYLWTVGIEGDLTVKGREVDFDKPFTDLVEAVEIGGSLLGVLQYDRFLVWGQADFFAMSTDELDVEDQPAGGSVDMDVFLAELAVGYQIDGWMEGQTFDLLVGVRNLHTETELKVTGVGTFEKENDLTDPILVVRPSIPIFPSKVRGLRFNPTLAIGGGGDSDLVYELQPQLQYNVTDNVAVRVGYRTVGYRFKGDRDDDNELNVAFSGLILGVGVTF